MTLHCPDSLAAITGFLNGLSCERLDTLGDVYSPGVEFKDPLHETRGIGALRKAYERVFQQLNNLSVTVTDSHGDDRTGFLLWTMNYQIRGKARGITGASHLKFAPDGRVAVQHDYWDASFPVFGEFPLIGCAMRGFRRMVE